MLRTKLLTIAFMLILIFTGIAVWADNTMYNLSHKINKQGLATSGSKNSFAKLTPESQASPIPEVATNLVNLAKTDVATKFNLDEANIKTEEVSQVSWSDSSLGCPKPDGVYLQVITNGWKIKLSSNNSIYEYHGDQSRVLYCPNPKE